MGTPELAALRSQTPPAARSSGLPPIGPGNRPAPLTPLGWDTEAAAKVTLPTDQILDGPTFDNGQPKKRAGSKSPGRGKGGPKGGKGKSRRTKRSGGQKGKGQGAKGGKGAKGGNEAGTKIVKFQVPGKGAPKGGGRYVIKK